MSVYSLIRSMKMRIKTIWAIHGERLAKPERAAFVVHKSMKKPKSESAKRCRKIFKSNKFMAATQQFANKFRERLQVLHLHRFKVSKLLIHKLPKSRSIQMPNISQIHRDFYQLESEQLKHFHTCQLIHVF